MKAEKARANLVEFIADIDEGILESYMENSDVSAKILKEAIRRATISNEVVPVLVGSSLKNKGVQRFIRCCY